MNQLIPASNLAHAKRTCSFPLCITPEAAETILETVGSRPAETGAKCWGPLDGFGIDHVEFDGSGSARASGAIYSPDAQWGAERVSHWLAQDPMKLWTGDCHSHPGSMSYPSRKSGPGLGDLGYVEAVFDSNPVHQYFALPIILPRRENRRTVEIAPWVISREDPHSPMLAEFVVCEASQFPKRILNPEWVGETHSDEPTPSAASDDLLERIRSLTGRGVVIHDRGRLVYLELPPSLDRAKLHIDLSENGQRFSIRFGGPKLVSHPKVRAWAEGLSSLLHGKDEVKA